MERRCEECGCCEKCCQCEYGETEEGVPICRCDEEPPAPSDTERKAKAVADAKEEIVAAVRIWAYPSREVRDFEGERLIEDAYEKLRQAEAAAQDAR
jgi:hypothetical protein